MPLAPPYTPPHAPTRTTTLDINHRRWCRQMYGNYSVDRRCRSQLFHRINNIKFECGDRGAVGPNGRGYLPAGHSDQARPVSKKAIREMTHGESTPLLSYKTQQAPLTHRFLPLKHVRILPSAFFHCLVFKRLGHSLSPRLHQTFLVFFFFLFW